MPRPEGHPLPLPSYGSLKFVDRRREARAVLDGKYWMEKRGSISVVALTSNAMVKEIRNKGWL